MRYTEYLWYVVYVLLFSFLSNQNINTINWHTDNGNFSWWIVWLFVYLSATAYTLFADCNSNCPANHLLIESDSFILFIDLRFVVLFLARPVSHMSHVFNVHYCMALHLFVMYCSNERQTIASSQIIHNYLYFTASSTGCVYYVSIKYQIHVYMAIANCDFFCNFTTIFITMRNSTIYRSLKDPRILLFLLISHHKIQIKSQVVLNEIKKQWKYSENCGPQKLFKTIKRGTVAQK